VLHVAVLGALAWAAGSWLRVPPPEEAPVLVTLVARGEAPGAGAAPMPPAPAPLAQRPAPTPSAPRPAPPPPARRPEPTPAARRPAPAPPARRPEQPPHAAQPAARPARRAGSPAPVERESAPDPSAPLGRSGASGREPAWQPADPAGEPGASEGAAAAESAPAPGVDVARVYGEGEVDRVAAPLGGIRRPEYPARERMMGREGRVSLLVEVDAAGAVRAVRVARSAGPAFDASARRAVEQTPFRAARLADRAVASTVTVDVSFELD
jgi:TonB family protein